MGVSQKARVSWQAGVLHAWLHLNAKPRIDTVAHGQDVQQGYVGQTEKTKDDVTWKLFLLLGGEQNS